MVVSSAPAKKKKFSILRWHRKNDIPVLPLLGLTVIVVVAIFAPILAPHSPLDAELIRRLKPPAFVADGNWEYPLGTDFFGRDVLSRLIYGTRISLVLALIAVLLSGSFGTIVGLVSAYYGKWVDSVLMRVVDLALSLPLILMAILFAAIFEPSTRNVIVVVALLLWPRYARQVRGESLSIMTQDFVALAKVAGCSKIRIMWRHLFPNVIPSLLVLATLQVGYVIILESSLSFLGVGIPSPTPAWGLMVAEGRGLLNSAWWISLWPGLAILFTVLSLNTLGDWVRDKVDPKMKQV